jgi:hypothetical protein
MQQQNVTGSFYNTYKSGGYGYQFWTPMKYAPNLLIQGCGEGGVFGLQGCTGFF